MKAVFHGGRGYNDARGPGWTRPADLEQRTVVNQPAWTTGSSLFTLAAEADDLFFRDLRFEHIGTVFKMTADILRLRTERIEVYNVQRYVEALSVSYRDCIFRDIDAEGFSKSLFRCGNDSSGNLWERVHGDGGYQSGDSFSRLIEFSGTSHDHAVTDCSSNWCVEDNGTSFWQGDGISSENATHHLTFNGWHAAKGGDGGMDLKSADTIINDPVVNGYRALFKIWSPSCIINNPLVGDAERRPGVNGQPAKGPLSCFQITGGTANVTINNPRSMGPLAAGQTVYLLQSANAAAGEAVGICNVYNDQVNYGTANPHSVQAGGTLTFHP